MSRDATGLYSAWAVRSSACPICQATIGEPCDVTVGSGHVEHQTHWERTESAPPFDPPAIETDDDAKRETIARYRDVFRQHGFGDHMIDFSDATSEAVEAMAEALVRLHEPSASKPAGREASARTETERLRTALTDAADALSRHHGRAVQLAAAERARAALDSHPAPAEPTPKPIGARAMMRLPHDETDPQKLYSFPDPDVLIDSYIALRDEVHPPFADSAEFAVGRRERSDSGKRVVTYTHAAYVLMLANAYLTLTTYELGQEHCIQKLRDIWRARRATPARRSGTSRQLTHGPTVQTEDEREPRAGDLLVHASGSLARVREVRGEGAGRVIEMEEPCRWRRAARITPTMLASYGWRRVERGKETTDG